MSKSLTYAEMAEALKITPESANRLHLAADGDMG